MGNVKTVVDDEKVRLSTKQTGAAGTHFDAGLSEEDKARVEAYRQMYYDARERGDSSAMAAAHEAAEYVRAGYGYSGGADGSEYIPVQQKKQELTVPEFTSGTKVEDYSDYLTRMYTAQKQAAMAELKSAYDNSMAELDRTEAGLAGTYQAARNDAAAVNEVQRRNFAQYAAANGLNSGTAGQAELARSVALQNDMNGIHSAEAAARADLQLQRAEAETEYNAAIAQAEYTGEYELAAALYKEKVRVQEALTEAEIRQQKYALERYQLQYQAQRDSEEDRRYNSEQAFEQEKYRDSLALEQAAQALKEKDQADNLELAWAAQILKEKDQADSSALGWAGQNLKEKDQADNLELAWAAQILKEKDQADSSALGWAGQNLKEKTQADDLELAWAAQILKEKDQADSSALAWAGQTLKEKTQADDLELAWAELTQEEQQALAAQILAEKKQEDATALDWAAQNLAQQKHQESQTADRTKQLAQTGEMYLKAGILPSAEMCEAMGITVADARRYILVQYTSQK